jgi:hypothetical protein
MKPRQIELGNVDKFHLNIVDQIWLHDATLFSASWISANSNQKTMLTDWPLLKQRLSFLEHSVKHRKFLEFAPGPWHVEQR